MRSILSALALTAPLLLAAACSTNPATGEQSFTAFMSENDELRVGAEEHPKILKDMGGTFKHPTIQTYVDWVGEKLAKVSDLPDLKFKFTVLDDPNINAFALPGGYVYITRGLIALAENEAEMAGVLAHEIGHVTARHTAQRYSAAMA
ncbi:MAG: M48 family metalloprotease, partial [Rhodospirillales bacterium]